MGMTAFLEIVFHREERQEKSEAQQSLTAQINRLTFPTVGILILITELPLRGQPG
jgi:hypothetical protein